MELDELQKQKVAQWIADGLKLSQIQTRIEQDFGLRVTYMEVRFLVDDLKLTPKDPEPAKPATPVPPVLPAVPAVPAAPAAPAPTAGFGRVSVLADAIARPGTLASGKVTFSDGEVGDWYLDQAGRLGVAPKNKAYRPSPGDVQAFQAELEAVLTRLGMA